MIGGEVQFTVMSSLLAAPQAEAGKLRALAIGGLQRDHHFPYLITSLARAPAARQALPAIAHPSESMLK
jgi:tripartite-type tricarboxylate transporter receptor subunit TctC